MAGMKSFKSDVRIGHSLNEAERNHLDRRTKTVQKCLQQQSISCTKDEVPNIAVLGSGGGLRAMVGLLGSLSQLSEEGLLNCIMYLSGVSGSTWCMASLYNESDWSTKLETVKRNIIKRLTGPSVSSLVKGEKLLKYYLTKDNFSLTDVWAALFVAKMVNEINESGITKQRNHFSSDPYPIYNVIDKKCKYDKLNADCWFEITPDESGYSLTGAFVNSQCLGSQFKNGKKIKEQPEIDMLYLQGLCGSIIAEMEELLRLLLSLIQDKMEPADTSTSQKSDEQKGREVLLNLVHLNLCAMKDQDPEVFLQNLTELLKDVWIAIARSIEKIGGWIWGKTYNYLNNMTVEGVDHSVLNSEKREYEDAGLLINSPYFSVLRKERNIDLIISLDFSAGDPYQTVVQTAKMCQELHIPYPKVVIPSEDQTEPKDFYVFRGYNKAPTVIHIPLFNSINCKGEIKEYKKRYQTFQMNYTSEMITDLLKKAALNIINNKKNLLTEIKYVTEQKKMSKLLK
ncbi:cytosolic phospholipase A2 gamma-like isoform X2 [Hoplias malabaricus]|uniref:cytosolic phospholipase A2 gamma-like isoform X2 n=1 Tax=Hoplias malabaricus TaxID=27720 RepID=UPI0034633FEE